MEQQAPEFEFGFVKPSFITGFLVIWSCTSFIFIKPIIISSADVVDKDDSQDQKADDDKQQTEDDDHCTLENIVDVLSPHPGLGELLVHALPDLVSVIIVILVINLVSVFIISFIVYYHDNIDNASEVTLEIGIDFKIDKELISIVMLVLYLVCTNPEPAFM